MAGGKQPDATVFNSIHQLKIPAHMLNRSRNVQETNKHVSDGVNEHPVENKCDLRPMPVKTMEAKDFSKSEAEMVDVKDTLQHVISNVELEIAKNPAFLQKEIDEQRHGGAHQQLSAKSVMRRTTEQITDVSCGNTAAPVWD